jgi:hypothetical protein
MEVALSKGKLEKASHYKELLDKAEEAKKRHEKMKFAEECEVSITVSTKTGWKRKRAISGGMSEV